MPRQKSPNYPAIGIQEAIDRIKSVYEEEHTNPAPRSVIAKALGYAGISGRSAVVIGALRQYGLLVGRGDELRVSEVGLALIHAPLDSNEYLSALRKACFKPELFSDINDHFGEKIPSDANLRYFLVKKGFSRRGQDRVISSYADTQAFITQYLSRKATDNVTTNDRRVDYEEGSEDHSERAPTLDQKLIGVSTRENTISLQSAMGGEHIERTVLCEGVVVELRFSNHPTYEDLEALADYVEFRIKRLKRGSPSDSK